MNAGTRKKRLPGGRERMGLLCSLLLPALVALAGCRGPATVQPSALAPLPRAQTTPEVPPQPAPALLRPQSLLPPPLPLPTVRRIPARPAVTGKLDVPVSSRWKYVVIHHSGAATGNMGIFDEWHKRRGWDGVGYHFVIGNGSRSGDGEIEVTFRWTEQRDGAHAGVKEYNRYGIGICLVGDFDHGYPTEKQMVSLVSLICYLQERCSIPADRILGHRHIKSTNCPGKNFPYFQMLSMLPH